MQVPLTQSTYVLLPFVPVRIERLVLSIQPFGLVLQSFDLLLYGLDARLSLGLCQRQLPLPTPQIGLLLGSGGSLFFFLLST